jgi:hypothetical protein
MGPEQVRGITARRQALALLARMIARGVIDTGIRGEES